MMTALREFFKNEQRTTMALLVDVLHDELLRLRNDALEFVSMIESEIQQRISDDRDDYDCFHDDADVLRMVGMGTDEDHDLIGGDSDLWGEF